MPRIIGPEDDYHQYHQFMKKPDQESFEFIDPDNSKQAFDPTEMITLPDRIQCPEQETIKVPGIVQFRLCTLSDYDLSLAVSQHLKKMYQYPVSVPPRHIPARPDEDFDLLVGEMIIRVLEYSAKLERSSDMLQK